MCLCDDSAFTFWSATYLLLAKPVGSAISISYCWWEGVWIDKFDVAIYYYLPWLGIAGCSPPEGAAWSCCCRSKSFLDILSAATIVASPLADAALGGLTWTWPSAETLSSKGSSTFMSAGSITGAYSAAASPLTDGASALITGLSTCITGASVWFAGISLLLAACSTLLAAACLPFSLGLRRSELLSLLIYTESSFCSSAKP